MEQYKYTRFDEDALEAMLAHNEQSPTSEKFTLIDVRILSLVHSYTYSNMQFFASNDYLARKCLTTPPTIQKSINKLCAFGMIDKKVLCVNGKKQRILTYIKSTP